MEPVSQAFPGTKAADGSIDRSLLSAAVAEVGRDEALKQLEAIVHPLVLADRTEFVSRAAADGEWLVVLDVPLLLETHTDEEELRAGGIDCVLVISAPSEIQRARVLKRPGMSPAKFEAILARQIPDAEKRRRADFVVETGYDSFAEARAQLAACLHELSQSHSAPFERWLRGECASATGSSGISPSGGRRAVRCVTLDLDDTLWPVLPPILAAQGGGQWDPMGQWDSNATRWIHRVGPMALGAPACGRCHHVSCFFRSRSPCVVSELQWQSGSGWAACVVSELQWQSGSGWAEAAKLYSSDVRPELG